MYEFGCPLLLRNSKIALWNILIGPKQAEIQLLSYLSTTGIKQIVNDIIAATDPRVIDPISRPDLTLQTFIDELPPLSSKLAL